VREAYRSYRKLQHGLRLNDAQYARVPRETLQAEIDGVLELWRTVFEQD
jgi:glutamate-ammonia-ligase adenylyltransferase